MNIIDTPLKVTTKEVTIREVYDALAHNGFKHLRGTWYDQALVENGEIIPQGGCVLAQTAINLGVAANDSSFSAVIIRGNFNENNQYTLYEQLRHIPIDKMSKWYDPGEDDDPDENASPTPNAGEAIIYWNDRINYADSPKDSYGDLISEKIVYALPTYADVAQMAYDILAPHFDKTITLVEASRTKGAPVTVVGLGYI